MHLIRRSELNFRVPGKQTLDNLCVDCRSEVVLQTVPHIEQEDTTPLEHPTSGLSSGPRQREVRRHAAVQLRYGQVSLNDLCSPQEDGLRNRQPERLGGLEVDDQLERSRSLHRQVTRLRAL